MSHPHIRNLVKGDVSWRTGVSAPIFAGICASTPTRGAVHKMERCTQNAFGLDSEMVPEVAAQKPAVSSLFVRGAYAVSGFGQYQVGRFLHRLWMLLLN